MSTGKLKIQTDMKSARQTDRMTVWQNDRIAGQLKSPLLFLYIPCLSRVSVYADLQATSQMKLFDQTKWLNKALPKWLMGQFRFTWTQWRRVCGQSLPNIIRSPRPPGSSRARFETKPVLPSVQHRLTNFSLFSSHLVPLFRHWLTGDSSTAQEQCQAWVLLPARSSNNKKSQIHRF